MRVSISRLRRQAAGVIAVLALCAGPAAADDPDFIAVSVGAFDVNDDETTAEARLEYRSDWRWWMFKPFGGVMGNADGGGYVYAGVLIDLFFGNRIVVTPSFAPGAYIEGDSKDLGSVLEFRSQIEVSYRFDNRSRLGVALSHMSNAGIGDDNPGTENLVLTYAVPFDTLFGD